MEELKNINPFEILLIDEYADCLKAGRLWQWLKRQKLAVCIAAKNMKIGSTKVSTNNNWEL